MNRENGQHADQHNHKQQTDNLHQPTNLGSAQNRSLLQLPLCWALGLLVEIYVCIKTEIYLSSTESPICSYLLINLTLFREKYVRRDE